jgi:hypothetical protein
MRAWRRPDLLKVVRGSAGWLCSAVHIHAQHRYQHYLGALRRSVLDARLTSTFSGAR